MAYFTCGVQVGLVLEILMNESIKQIAINRSLQTQYNDKTLSQSKLWNCNLEKTQ